MKYVFIFLLMLFETICNAQNFTYYAAVQSGLNVRNQPNANAKVIGKIDYGQKVTTLSDFTELKPIVAEGFNGFWWKVKYNNTVGYVVSSYLLPAMPPKAGTKTLKNYFSQITTTVTGKLIIRKNKLAGGGEYEFSKQLYKNGMEYHEVQGYEYQSEVYILPEFTVEQCYLLIRLINMYPDIIGEKAHLPIKNGKITDQYGEKNIEIEKDTFNGELGPLKRIKITSSQGAYIEFEIFDLNGQGVISFSSGV